MTATPSGAQTLIGDQQGSGDLGAPQHPSASAQLVRATLATENLVERVETEFGLLSSREVGERLGAKSEDAEDLAARTRHDGQLLAIRRDSQDHFPAFQFQHGGAPKPVIRSLRALCDRHGWSEFDLFLWLVVTTTRFDGERPVDVMLAEGLSAEQRILEAAEMEMTTQW